MKRLSKQRLLGSETLLESCFTERNLLAFTSSPFLCNLHSAFQDQRSLFMVIDLAEGGDLAVLLDPGKGGPAFIKAIRGKWIN